MMCGVEVADRVPCVELHHRVSTDMATLDVTVIKPHELKDYACFWQHLPESRWSNFLLCGICISMQRSASPIN